jgi:hypothetical protein
MGPDGHKGETMKTTTVKIRGLTPLIMHNGRLADPLDPATQALARLTSKRKKTEEDHREVGKVEWHGSLYVDEKGRPCLPGEVIEAALVEGAKRFKLGKVAKGGIVVDGNYALEYDGPKTADKLWAHGGFLKRAGVKVGTSRVIRSRPIFPEWAVAFEVLWDPTLVKDEDQIIEIAESAGMTGIGDWRPKFGRFEVVS